ncbi:MAG: hypothetical protein K2I49_02390, partial [Ureaplasma sp.]|nr:hypothetical protein [Ureaplasma sp.]
MKKNNVVEPIYPSWWTKPSTTKKESENYILPAGLGGMTFLFNFISSLLIFCFKWDTKWCNENKKLWGLLSMFIVFAISEIIFCSIGIYKAKKSPKDNILD